MKKIMITTIATIVLAVSMYCAPAQIAKGLSMNVATLKENDSFTGAIPPGKEPAVYKNEVSTKALRHFEKTFAGATGEKWSITASGFVTRFIFNGNVTRAFYDKNGNWLFTIAYYGEQKLPADIRATVKSVYY